MAVIGNPSFLPSPCRPQGAELLHAKLVDSGVFLPSRITDMWSGRRPGRKEGLITQIGLHGGVSAAGCVTPIGTVLPFFPMHL